MDHLDPQVSPNDTSVENPGRRELLKALAAGGGAIAASTLLPGQWVKPVIEAGHLPAHAQASPTSTSTPTPISTPTSTPTPTPTTPAPIVYSISCTANPASGETSFVEDITATVSATGGASVENIEVQYIAFWEGQGSSATQGATNNSGVASLGDFEFCAVFGPFAGGAYEIVVSFVDQVTYGNDMCTLAYEGGC